MPEKSQPKINWQPISALSLIASLLDGLLDEVENQYANLQACRLTPYVLDHDPVGRVIEVYSTQAADVRLYEEQR